MNKDFIQLNNTSLSPEIIKQTVLPKYDLFNAEISIIKFKNTDKQRAVYKVDYKNKSYCLKKVYYSKEDLLYVYSACEWLYRNNIRVPKLLPTIDNSRFVKYNDMLFILSPWVDGIRCNFDDLNHVIISIKKLSEIHSKTRSFIPILGSSSRKGFDNYYISTLKHFEDLLKASNFAFKYRDKFSRQFISNFESSLKLAQISLDFASKIDTDKLSCSLCHGDYVNKNLIFPEDLSPWIIDFDKCKMDYSMKDLGYFMRRLLKRENTRWDVSLAILILKTYNNTSPLTDSDIYYILSYISFPQKYWKVSRDYYKNIHKCNKSAFLTLLNNSISKTDNQYEFAINLLNQINIEFNKHLTLST
ncbi:MAG: CotS family spore coat protein [Clostridium butyricum]|nr:CotS family spore coat protein [Clostridium butyricum]